MQIEIWSDIACPWCFVGKRRFEAAMSQFAHRDKVEVIWRSYELDPYAPPSYGITTNELLSRKYGATPERAAKMNEHLTQVAALDGLAFRTDIAQPGNTFDAHRLTHFAGAHGKRNEMIERLMKAYLEEGELMSDRETLVRLATDVGLDAGKTREMLDGEAFGDLVRADELGAQELGINGVPFFVINERYAISGAQPVASFLDALNQAWNKTDVDDAATGEQCTDAGCAVHQH